MSDNRVLPVYNSGIVTALVEHTQLEAQDIRKVDGALHCALIRTHDHRRILAHLQVRNCADECLEKLVGWHEGIKAREGNCVLNPRIMSVKGDDVRYTHPCELLERNRTVQRFSLCPPVLPSSVQKRHDNRDPLCLSVSSRDDPLEIGIVVIRGHIICFSAHLVLNAAVQNIDQNVEIGSADGIIDDALPFTGSEARAGAADQIAVLAVSDKREVL